MFALGLNTAILHLPLILLIKSKLLCKRFVFVPLSTSKIFAGVIAKTKQQILNKYWIFLGKKDNCDRHLLFRTDGELFQFFTICILLLIHCLLRQYQSGTLFYLEKLMILEDLYESQESPPS